MHTLRSLLLVLVLAFVASTAACDTAVNIAVVSAGTTLAQLHANHQRVYTEATDQLIDAGLRGDAYLAAVAPMDVEFDHRTRTLAVASAVLYGAASVIDTVRKSRGDVPAAVRDAARDILHALQDVVDVFTDSHALPAPTLPPQMRVVASQLAVIAGVDAGTAEVADAQ